MPRTLFSSRGRMGSTMPRSILVMLGARFGTGTCTGSLFSRKAAVGLAAPILEMG